MSPLLITALLLLADPPAKSDAPAPVKLSALPRAGYALVTADAGGDKPLKQVEYIVSASGTAAEVTYDQAGNTLIVTLPPTGSVVVHAVALLADGTLAAPVSVELGQKQPDPGPAPATGAGKLGITLVVNLKTITAEQKALLEYQPLKQSLQALGHNWLFADVASPAFQMALAKAAAVHPQVPKITETPFLFVLDGQGNFHSAYRLTLGADPQANASVILDLFKPRK
jgi:hypothetical protein